MESRWLLLMLTQPTGNAALRMRVWREMKARGAALLRDGVYLLPDGDNARAAFDLLAEAVGEGGGSAHVVRAQADARQQRDWQARFDRADAYAGLLERCQRLIERLGDRRPEELRRRLHELDDEMAAIVAVDYFPGPAQAQLQRALADLRAAVERLVAADEPRLPGASPTPQARERFVGRIWATRRGLWIDRVASAWLIRRFIDPQARFVWLKRPADKPARAVGFDFDGAEFSHAGGRVTFEVLAASFGLGADPALARLGAIVRLLDVGGVAVAEARGFEAVMSGLRRLHAGDSAFLDAAGAALDACYAAFGAAADAQREQREADPSPARRARRAAQARAE